MRSSSLSVLALSLVLPAVSVPAFAQTETTLDPVILSGGLTPIRAADYGSAFTVVTAEEIEKRGITSLQDALRAVPGVAVNGSGRDFTQVRIRGQEANHTLILVDGIDIRGGGSEATLAGLDTLDIERVEVLRGPQTVFWGSRASAGVINIITRKAEGTGYGLRAEVGNGHLLSSYVQTRTAAGGLRFTLNDLNDKNYDYSGQNGEKDFIRRQTARLNGDWQASDALYLTFAAEAVKEKSAYDNYGFNPVMGVDGALDDPDQFNVTRQTSLSFGAAYGRSTDRVVHHLNIAQVRTRSKGGEDTDSLPWSRNSSTTLKYRAEIGLDGAAGSAAHVLNLMAEKRRDRGYAPASSWASEAYYARDTKSLAAEYRGQLSEAFSLQAGLRRDMNTAFDDFTAWNIAGSWRYSDQIRVHASAGRAAVAPTFGELHNVTSNWQGNPYLTPEISTGADIGVEWTSADGRGRVDVTAFWQEMKNEIVTSWASYPLRPENDPRKMRARGIEVQAEWSLGEQLSVGAGYTWQQAEKQDGTVAVRRPRHELGLTTTWTSADQKFEVSGNMRLVAGNYDYTYINNMRQPGAEQGSFTTFNLAGSYALNDQVKLTARVQNLFDRKHSDVLGYRAQERAVWVGVNANF